MTRKRINVTQAFLPPLEDYQQYLQRIWDSDWITNQGPLLQELEAKLQTFLGVDNFQLISNGTMALQVALQALDITEGEVITTPFSYVATTSSILWQRCRPVFVDIEPDTFCVDASKIEAAITSNTKAIMAVHVFGHACDVEAIEAVAQRHDLKVIYDGAHAFGAKHNGKSLLDYGDISICSFHATKLFHTIEGGAIITADQAVADKVELIKRFGHNYDDHIMLGINAKASEFQAAMGLCNLKYIEAIVADRKRTSQLYDQLLDGSFERPAVKVGPDYNYAYYPLLVDNEAQLLKIIIDLNRENVFPRRYFYPSLNELSYLSGPKQPCPISEDITSRILCLPLYYELETESVEDICETIKTSIQTS